MKYSIPKSAAGFPAASFAETLRASIRNGTHFVLRHRTQRNLKSAGVLAAASALGLAGALAAPHLVSTASMEGLNTTGDSYVGVAFDTTLDPVSATNVANYGVSGVGGLDWVHLRSDGKSVTLAIPAPAPNSFTVTVTGVKDTNGVVITPGSTVNGANSGYVVDIVGGTNPKGYASSVGSGDVEVSAGGNDIWAANDNFTYAHQDRTGDFDVQVELADVRPPSNRNGLMMRDQSVGFGVANACAYSTLYGGQLPGSMLYGFHGRKYEGGPMDAQWFNVENNWLTINGTPPRWLRLKRVGPTFYSFYSTNGTAWTADGVLPMNTNGVPTMPATAALGLAQNNGNNTTTLGVTHYTGIADFSWPQGHIVVTQPPTNTTVLQNRPYVLSAAGTAYATAGTGTPLSPGEITYQWQRNGIDLPGEINPTYSVAYASLADNTASYQCILTISGGAHVTAGPAILTVNADTVPPTMTLAWSLNTSSISLTFNEEVDPASATNTANYTVAGAVTAASLRPDKKTVDLTISGMVGTTYSVTVHGVQDLAGNPVSSANKTGNIQGLTDTYVGTANNNAASRTTVPVDGEFDVTAGGDDIWGANNSFYYLNKPQSGNFDYMVHIQSENVGANDNNLLFRANLTGVSAGAETRSYGASPPGSQILFAVAPASGNFNWPPGYNNWTINSVGAPPNQYLRLKRVGDQFWGFISFDGLSWQNIGSDKTVIADPGYIGLGTVNGLQQTVYKNFGLFSYPSVVITLTTQPVSQTIMATLGVTFTAAATATSSGTPLPAPEITYQWQRNGSPIAGATTTKYHIDAVLPANNNDHYRCVVSVSGGSQPSTDGVLTVTPKTTKPLVLSSSGVQPGEIGIHFDSLMDGTTTTNLANYSVAGGTVTNVILSADGYSVALLTTVSGSTFDVTINNVQDAVGNIILANTHATGTFAPLTAATIGSPDTAGYTASVQPGKFTLSAGGSQRDNGGDNLHFVYQPVTGDFDKIINLTSLPVTVPSTRAGLMARASLDSISRLVELTADGDAVTDNHRIVLVGTNDNPTSFTLPDYGDTNNPSPYYVRAGGPGGVQANLVDNGGSGQWLRIRRTGQSFHFFVKSGTNAWAQFVSKHSPDMPKTMYVGFYIAVNNPVGGEAGQTGTASFEGWGDYAKSGDSTAPTLVSAGTKDKSVIGVKFSEDINGATINAANFTVTASGGETVTVTSADTAMMGDGVYLTVSGLTSDNFTVHASGVADLAGNVMTPASISGKVSGFLGYDVGVFNNPAVRPQHGDCPYIIGSSIALSSGNLLDIDIITGGYNNGVGSPTDPNVGQGGFGTDQGQRIYKEITGNFDVMCQVLRYDVTDDLAGWANGGLTVFAYTNAAGLSWTNGTYPNGRLITNNTWLATSIPRFSAIGYCQNAANGSLAYTTGRDTLGAGQWDTGPQIGTGTADGNGIIGRWSRYLNVANASGAHVAGYNPSVEEWHRLVRTGTTVNDYWSHDGVTWALMVTRDMPAIPSDCYIGFQYAVDDNPGFGGGASKHYCAIAVRNFGATAQITGQPTLTISYVNGVVELTWAFGTGFVLQGSPTVGPSSWSNATDLHPVNVGNNWTVSIPPGSATRFFRLAR